MSYNIDNWTTVELKNLAVPLDVLVRLRDTQTPDFWANVHWSPPDMKRFSVSLRNESCDIEGWVDDTTAHFESFAISGAGSGHAFASAVMWLLGQSAGELKAFLVWEVGEEVSLLNVKDGKVEHKNLSSKDLLKLFS